MLPDSTTKLHNLSLKQLVELYNEYAPKPVKKFADRASALRRIGALIQSPPLPTIKSPVVTPIFYKPKSPRSTIAAVTVTSTRTPKQVHTFKSVAEAFKTLKLPLAKHKTFRKQLKQAGSATFEGYQFTATARTSS